MSVLNLDQECRLDKMIINKILTIINLTIIIIIVWLQSQNEHKPRTQQSILESQQIEYLQDLEIIEQKTQTQTKQNKIILKYLKSYYEQKEYLRNIDKNVFLLDLDDLQEKIKLKPFTRSELIRKIKSIRENHPLELYQLFLLGDLALIASDDHCDAQCQKKIKYWINRDLKIQDAQNFLNDWQKKYPELKTQVKVKNKIDPQLITWGFYISIALLTILVLISILKYLIDRYTLISQDRSYQFSKIMVEYQISFKRDAIDAFKLLRLSTFYEFKERRFSQKISIDQPDNVVQSKTWLFYQIIENIKRVQRTFLNDTVEGIETVLSMLPKKITKFVNMQFLIQIKYLDYIFFDHLMIIIKQIKIEVADNLKFIKSLKETLILSLIREKLAILDLIIVLKQQYKWRLYQGFEILIYRMLMGLFRKNKVS